MFTFSRFIFEIVDYRPGAAAIHWGGILCQKKPSTFVGKSFSGFARHLVMEGLRLTHMESGVAAHHILQSIHLTTNCMCCFFRNQDHSTSPTTNPANDVDIALSLAAPTRDPTLALPADYRAIQRALRARLLLLCRDRLSLERRRPNHGSLHVSTQITMDHPEVHGAAAGRVL